MEETKRKYALRTKAQKEEHKKIIANLYLKGNSQNEIAEKIGISRQQVSKDIQEIYAAWQKESIKDLSELKLRELTKLDQLEAELWNLYEQSKIDRKKTIKRAKKNDTDKEYIEVSEIIEQGCGDKSILDSITNIIEKRGKILGLEKIQIQHSGSLDITMSALEKMTNDELDEFINKLSS